MEVSNLQIHPPANIIFAGASGSGKTTILARLLENKNRIFSTPPVHTLYCYRAWQSLYDEMKMKKTVSSFHQGLPSNQKIEEEANKYKRQNGMILILDDLVNEAFASNILDLVKLFTVSGHHLNITVIILLHNLFSKELRTISLNTHHFFITKNPRAASFERASLLSILCLLCDVLRSVSPYFHLHYLEPTGFEKFSQVRQQLA